MFHFITTDFDLLYQRKKPPLLIIIQSNKQDILHGILKWDHIIWLNIIYMQYNNGVYSYHLN